MRTFSRPAHLAGRGALGGLLIVAATTMSAYAADPPPATAPALTAEQREKINAADSPAELLSLGKQFTMLRQLSAAEACIVKAVQKQPALLSDPKAQTPSSWNDLWFTRRAEIREKKLKADDAAGRVEIAQWLYQAGQRKPARSLLTKALEINPKLPEALQLAEEWHLGGGGPVQFDLSFGFSHALFAESVSDEGEPVALTRPDHNTLLLLPFAYEAGSDKLVVSKTSIKVSTESGRSCRVVGMLLLESPDAGINPDAPTIARGDKLELQNNQDPLWEQLEIELTPEQGVTVTCLNTVRPASKRLNPQQAPQPRVRPSPSPRGRSGRGIHYGWRLPIGRAGIPNLPELAARGLGAWLQINRFPLPKPRSADRDTNPDGRADNSQPRIENDPRKQIRPGSGFAVFVIEIPQDAQQIIAAYRDEFQVTLDAEWLATLDKAPASLQGKERNDYIADLLKRTESEDVLTAAAAAGKLGQVRDTLQSGAAGADASLAAPKPGGVASESDQIIAALMKSIASDKPLIARAAFNSLVLTAAPVPAAMLAATGDANQAALAKTVLTELERCFAALQQPTDEDKPAEPVAPYVGTGSDPLTIAVAELPEAKASPNLCAVLAATLRNSQPELAKRAVELVLANASRECVATLADVPSTTRSLVAAQLAEVKDEAIKMAVLRVQLIRPDARTLPALLKTCEGSVLTVRGENDPLFTAFKSGLPAECAISLLNLVAKADLSGLTSTTAIDKLLERVERDAQTNKTMRAALLELALTQFRGVYEAPLPADLSGSNDPGSTGGGIESLLARLATSPGADSAMAMNAAVALLGAGRITALGQQVDQMTNEAQRAALIRGLADKKELWQREALYAFLAARLKEENRKSVGLAFNALAGINKTIEPADRWRFNLFTKFGLNLPEMIKLTVGAEDRVTLAATGLLRQLGQFTNAEADQVQTALEANSRLDTINQIYQHRLEKPPGRMACMLYLDMEPIARGGDAPPPAPGSNPRSLLRVPLPGPDVNIVTGSAPRTFDVMVAERSIRNTSENPTGAGTEQGTPVDISVLLKEAIHTADPAVYPFVTVVDQFALNEKLPGSIKHHSLGTWMGTVDLTSQPGDTSPDSSLRITRVRVMLEPRTR